MTQPRDRQQRQMVWWWGCWGLLAAVCVVVEIARQVNGKSGTDWLLPFASLANDSPMFLPVVLLFPLAWWVRSGLVVHRADLVRLVTTSWIRSRDQPQIAVLWVQSAAIGILSCLMSWQVGRTMRDLPPAYHDEYSYVFQAETLLSGRFSFPSHPTVAPVFDQLHVVNQGRFASRYYPGTGAWLAPWVALGHPYWGHWLAGACTSMLMFWSGRELGGAGVGLIAGLLTALSPGLALFSNLLLAHHPTLLGLSLFLFGFLRWMNSGRATWLLLSGLGLSFAMLCRPATAAAVGFPFGIWFVWWLFPWRMLPASAIGLKSTASEQTDPARMDRNSRTLAASATVPSPRERLRAAAMLGTPLVIGWMIMASYNASITGSWTRSPYQAYTDHYTPRHVFGFHNVTRGAMTLGDRVLPVATRNYDAWAEELTASLAVRNVGNRLMASWRWTFGIVPIVWLGLMSIGLWKDSHPAFRLIATAIVTLHVMHIPYWFDGIMHWHYVFESSVLWLLLLAGSVSTLSRIWRDQDRPWLIVWLVCFLATGIGANYISGEPYWSPLLRQGIVEVRYSRRIYSAFQQQLRREVTELPALVLVVPDPADRHMDYVTNHPSLSSPIVIGRFVPTEASPDDLQVIANAFPDRKLYLYEAKSHRLTELVLERL